MGSKSPSDDGPGGPAVHPQGLCESDAVGPGTRVWAFAHVMPGAVIGANCNIGEQCFVEGGATVGNNVTVKNGVQLWDKVHIDDDVFIGPNATFTNDLRPRAFVKRPPAELVVTHVGHGATIGANATVVCGITIGRFAFVAAGAVVRRDVPPHGFVAGNPAQLKGWVCTCGARLPASLACGGCGRAYRLAPDGNGLAPAP